MNCFVIFSYKNLNNRVGIFNNKEKYVKYCIFWYFWTKQYDKLENKQNEWRKQTKIKIFYWNFVLFTFLEWNKRNQLDIAFFLLNFHRDIISFGISFNKTQRDSAINFHSQVLSFKFNFNSVNEWFSLTWSKFLYKGTFYYTFSPVIVWSVQYVVCYCH